MHVTNRISFIWVVGKTKQKVLQQKMKKPFLIGQVHIVPACFGLFSSVSCLMNSTKISDITHYALVNVQLNHLLLQSIPLQEFHELPFLKKFKFKRQDRVFPKVAPPPASTASAPVPSASSDPSIPLPEGAPAGKQKPVGECGVVGQLVGMT